MTSKMTIPEIKARLEVLGVPFKRSLRKAELLAILEEYEADKSFDTPYSPPHTRRKTMTVAVDQIKSDIMTIEGSPLNHASAILTELENSHSEEVSVDVQITKEGEGAQSVERREEVVHTSEQSATTTEEEEEEEEMEEDSDSEFEIIKEDELVMSNGTTTTTTTTTTRRRSERIQSHTECSAALFSDEEDLVEVEETAEEAEAAKERWSHLLVIFTISILIAVIANAIAYIHISRPEILQSLADRLSGLFISTSGEGESSAAVSSEQN